SSATARPTRTVPKSTAAARSGRGSLLDARRISNGAFVLACRASIPGQQTAVGVRGRLDRARTYEHKRGAEGRQPGPARRCPEVPAVRALSLEFGPKDAIHCAPIPPPGNRAARRDWFRGGARRQHCQWPEGLLMQFRALK